MTLDYEPPNIQRPADNRACEKCQKWTRLHNAQIGDCEPLQTKTTQTSWCDTHYAEKEAGNG